MGEIGVGGMGEIIWWWLRPMTYVKKIGEKTDELIAKWIDEKFEEKIDSLTGGKIAGKIDRWTGVKTVERIIDQMLVANYVGSIGQTMWRANMAEKGETMPT